MPPDATDTKKRILDAAFREFAAYGLAGARIDRIAEHARANKRSIYAHFGNKEELFDIVVDQILGLGAQAIPARWDDLPAYVGDLFDYLIADRDVFRLTMWRQLERNTVSDAERETYRTKVAAFEDAERRGILHSPAPALDMIAILTGISYAWLISTEALRTYESTDPYDPGRLQAHRNAIITSTVKLLR